MIIAWPREISLSIIVVYHSQSCIENPFAVKLDNLYFVRMCVCVCVGNSNLFVKIDV